MNESESHPVPEPDELLACYEQLTAAQKHELAAFLDRQLASSQVRKTRRELVEQIDFLQVLLPEERDTLATHLVEIEFNEGAFMTQEGGADNWLYLIAEGEAEVLVAFEGSNITKPVATLGSGDFFGEMALLTGEPRSASVIARSSVRCYRLGPKHFDEHLRSRPEIVEAISDIFARRLVELRNVRDARRSLFDALPEEEREALWAELDEVTFAPDSEIARQGAEEDWMYIIINGKAEVRVQDSDNAQSRKVATLRQGDIFVEMAVLSDQPRSATVTALTRVDCYQLKKSVLDQLLADYPKLKDSLEEILSHREAEFSEAQSGLVEDRDRERIDNLRSGLARRINRFFSIGIPKDASQAGDSDSYTHRAIGRLFFAAPTTRGEEKPLHNMPIELWHHGVFDLILGHTTTARDGTFEIWYDAAQIGANANLELRVFETHHTYNKHGELSFSPRHVYTIPGDGTVETKFDFGDQYVPYWEYDPDQPM